MHKARRRLGLMFAAVAVPLAVASAAYACAALATLSLAPGKGRPGAVVTGHGYNYSTAEGASRVEIRVNSRSGALLATTTPNDDRTIDFSFAIPRRAPGYYTILATQYTASGAPVAGTPGRASLKILRTRNGTAAVIAPAAGNEDGARLTFDSPAGAAQPSSAFLFVALAGMSFILGASLHWVRASRSTAKISIS